ncbi:4a-hydroxytetrahydrobiopterin dehydratase [Catellatospora bangladeshensis]|uniref:Putative pterin-4-alpha-carbinolamine dehydratase n=1 Tax=Catellatospora bangladeshensis TaxID=310355 RepID=A0A8J3NKC6_9ACTN|nr:4a-hydroxytetrahydrobiopterin dehydratase [Catellatospora bangladeshensis]GIF83937.1 4a-hydroxytetrahydrobiopterin dehydratase [Catellatospora bangladeshensis]
MVEVLNPGELERGLTALSGWTGDVHGISRTVKLPSFPAALAVVARVGEAAESMDHHPDMDIRYRTLTFTCCTHAAGGLTELDLRLARLIDDIVSDATTEQNATR